MKLIRCSDQTGSLEDFYQNLGKEIAHYDQGASAMLSLIQKLRNMPDSCQVWALTSHARLCLLSSDSYSSPWYVILSVLDKNNYTIQYRMRDEEAPWKLAYVVGEATNEDDAIKMILMAMKNCGGWQD